MNANDIIDEAFDEFASQFDHESDEWLDMDIQRFFAAGWKAALKSTLPVETVSEAMVKAARDAFDAAYAAEYIGGALGCRDNKDIALLAALEAALAHVDDGWQPIESDGRNPDARKD